MSLSPVLDLFQDLSWETFPSLKLRELQDLQISQENPSCHPRKLNLDNFFANKHENVHTMLRPKAFNSGDLKTLFI